ncbi:MAG: hypothetical protein OEV80_02935, partial [candidate division Zixibacteria bacterium]|nr:hypothetical protein [candidate division Zixibacteria bacterium]
MTGRYRTLVGMLVACFFVSTTVLAAQQAKQVSRPISPVAKSATNVTAHGHGPLSTDVHQPGQPLGRAETASTSPGKLIGDTWYDLQQNGSMGRMVDWGWDDSNQVLVHFTWTRWPVYPGSDRSAAYNCYYSVTDSMLGLTMVQDPATYGGFPSIDAAVDNRAVIAAHSSGQPCVYWDVSPGFGFFGDHSCVPDSVGFGIWPKMRYQDIAGQTPVTHVFSQVLEPDAGDPQAIYYSRKVGVGSAGDWDYPAYVVDTVFDIAQDVACSNVDGKMALVWIANRPDPGDCDTCSSQNGQNFAQWDNDVYYQISNDYGATFQPRVNMTMNVDGVDGYRPYTDLSPLIGSDNNLRIAWNGRFWPADANSGGNAGLLRCRMFYWGENLGFGGFDTSGNAIIRTAAKLDWDQTTCNGGSWQLNGSKMTLSECDGNLYYLWTQFNDVANGIEDDCAERAFGAGGDAFGSANGEIYLIVSDDGGFSWDLPRNLTNTYTPHCDIEGGPGGRCQSEHFPSMSRFGTNQTLPGSDYVVIDPGSGYTGDYFLDVQYIDDPSPGVIVQDEGSWMLNEVRWFRLPCVEPEFLACIGTSGANTTSTGHGQPSYQWVSFFNDCNLDANYTLTITDHTGPPGWLEFGLPETGVIQAGAIYDVGLIMNAGGIVNEPGTWVTLRATLLFEGPFENSPLSFDAVCHVIPEAYELWPDTLETGCLSLIVRGNGNYGSQGAGKVNMDFFNYGDCDDLEFPDDTIPGYSQVYLYDASPVICWPDGDSVLCNWSIFGSSPWLSHGFLPVSYEPPVDSGDFVYYESEFQTQDSGVGVRQSWYAPKDQPDTCQFLVHRLRIFSNDGQTHT